MSGLYYPYKNVGYEECKKCGGRLIEDVENGFITCKKCGLVNQDTIIHEGPEWRNFDSEACAPNMERVGAPENDLFHGGDLHTFIDGNKELTTYGSDLRSRRDIAMMKSMKVCKEFAERINLLESVTDMANEYFAKMLDSGELKGRSYQRYIIACLFVACRMSNVPRSHMEFESLSGFNMKSLNSAVQHVKRILGLSLPTPSGSEYVSRIVSELGLPYQVESLAKYILEYLSINDLLEGKRPLTKVGVAIIIAVKCLEIEADEKDIAKATGVAMRSLKTPLKEIEEEVPIIMEMYTNPDPEEEEDL